jgi:hypothetical protein
MKELSLRFVAQAGNVLTLSHLNASRNIHFSQCLKGGFTWIDASMENIGAFVPSQPAMAKMNF